VKLDKHAKHAKHDKDAKHLALLGGRGLGGRGVVRRPLFFRGGRTSLPTHTQNYPSDDGSNSGPRTNDDTHMWGRMIWKLKS
jgi:hypothetical protein